MDWKPMTIPYDEDSSIDLNEYLVQMEEDISNNDQGWNRMKEYLKSDRMDVDKGVKFLQMHLEAMYRVLVNITGEILTMVDGKKTAN